MKSENAHLWEKVVVSVDKNTIEKKILKHSLSEMVAPEGMLEIGEGFGARDLLWRSRRKHKAEEGRNDTGLMFGYGRMGRRPVLLAFGPVAMGQWYKRSWEK